jgi:hypothetical protein
MTHRKIYALAGFFFMEQFSFAEIRSSIKKHPRIPGPAFVAPESAPLSMSLAYTGIPVPVEPLKRELEAP